ncbi:MAG: hypothetical protein IJ506_05890 [Clostridia bacterium]|nr:hypothetical protein [Clostridia bacterium]
MCQLNVYCVPKTVEKEKVLALMEKYMGCQVAERIDEENLIPALQDGYSFYISGGMRCNCDSLPCQFQSEDASLSYRENWQKILNGQRESLNRLKEFMEEKEYPQKKKAFDKLYKRYSEEMRAAFEGVRKFEIQKSEEIMGDSNLSEEEKSRKMHEEVYPEVERRLKGSEEDPRVKNYYAFLEENRTMWETYALTKKRAKKKTGKAASVDGDETVEIPFPSLCIYDMIDDLENDRREQAGENEYAGLTAFIKEILSLAPEIKLFSYWQTGEPVEVKAKQTVALERLTIEKIVHLKYGEVLTVTK